MMKSKLPNWIRQPFLFGNVHYKLAISLAIVGTCLFATKSILIKLAYAEGAQPTTLLTLRMVLALPVYIGILCLPSKQSSLRQVLNMREYILLGICGFLGYYLSSYLDFLSLKYISAQLERLALFTYPACVCLIAWLCGIEKITTRVVFAIGIGWLGIVLVYIQDVDLSPQAPRGLGLVFAAVVSFSLYVIFAKGLIRTIGTRRFTSIAMCVASIFVLIHYLATAPLINLYNNSLEVFGYAIALAFFSTIIPSFMMNIAIAKLGVTRATAFGSAGPIFTIALAIVILNEPYTSFHMLGTIFVLGSMWLLARAKSA